MDRTPWIIAVDGPAGSGKSSICKKVCEDLGFTYVNTGYLYRTAAYIARDRDISFDDEQAIAELPKLIEQHIEWEVDSGQIFYKGKSIGSALSDEDLGALASKVATNPELRRSLLPLQRKLALQCSTGALLDGRDIGTVVFPDADLKIFMTASLEERAHRRLLQVAKNSQETLAPSLEQIMEDIRKRDAQDSNRSCAPLVKSNDAIEFDTSSLSLGETIAAMRSLIEKNLYRSIASR